MHDRSEDGTSGAGILNWFGRTERTDEEKPGRKIVKLDLDRVRWSSRFKMRETGIKEFIQQRL